MEAAMYRLEALQGFAMTDRNGNRYLPLTLEEVAFLLDGFTPQEWNAMFNGLRTLAAK